MSATWQAPFRLLREQFLAASREHFRVSLALASFPGYDSYRVWYDRTINVELLREVTNSVNQEPGQRTQSRAIGTVWGEGEGVQRFHALATEAGNSLPFDFYPANRLFPWFNELSNVNPGPVTLWSEFLFVTRIPAFRLQEDDPVRGCRVARLEGDPFLTSATAIEQFLLTPTAPNLGDYFRRMRQGCPWLINNAGGFPMTPRGVLDSPFLQFDLVRVFRSAVELGAALAARDVVEATAAGESAAPRFLADLEAGRAVEVAGERLLCVVNPRTSSVTEWSRQLDLADASPDARQALRTLGLAVADIRGDWEGRGRELLAGGAWHLWSGMGAEDRADARDLLAETRRLWGWPTEDRGEPGEYTGPRATLSDPRVVDHRWQTRRADYPNQVRAHVAHENFLVDLILLPNGGHFDIYRDDVKGTCYSVPSVCVRAEPKPPLELRPDGDMLAELECRFRDLGLIGPDESIHWVGRQTRGPRCGCELTPAGLDGPRPPEWRTLRDLRAAIVALMKWAGPYVDGRGAGRIFPASDREMFDLVAERVYGLAQSLNIPLPPVVTNPHDVQIRPHGPTALPVYERAEGLFVSAAAGRQWLSSWRAVRIGVDARLEQLDRAARPDADDGVDTRTYPLDAPSGTPSPLREAFESVAGALFEAAGFRREPLSGAAGFRELGGQLATRIGAANQQYANAELQLQAVADAAGCAHQDALAALRALNDAIGHVALEIVPGHMAVAHIRQVPAPDVPALLRRMRQQVSRAAHAARPSGHVTVANPSADRVPPDPAGKRTHTAIGEERRASSTSIDTTELAVLEELRARHPVLLKNVDIEAATDLGKQKIGEVIGALIAKGLVARPNGERKGAALTPDGLALVDRIRNSSADHP